MDIWICRFGAGIVGAALFLGSAGLSIADEEGTGFDPGDSRGGLAIMNTVLGTSWTNTREDHQDYVEKNGILKCQGCHDVEGVGYFGDFAPGCLTCHEAEFCGTPGSSDVTVCYNKDLSNVALSAGTQMMNTVLGVDVKIWAEKHEDLVESMGVESCAGCHDLNSGGKPSANTYDAQGCLSCHGREWDDGDRDDGDRDDDRWDGYHRDGHHRDGYERDD